MARIVVTGAGGFIGSAVVRRLLRDGDQVIAVDVAASEERQADNLQSVQGHPALVVLGVDLLDVDLGELLVGADAVVHLAGQPGVRTSWSDFGRHLDRNVLLTQRILDAALGARCGRVVVASSSSIYGHDPGRPSRETDPVRPLHPYGISKAAAEQVAAVYVERGVDVVCLRYFTVYGPRQRPDMAFHRLIDAASGGPAFPCYSSLDRVRDVTFVEDVVTATLAAVDADLSPGSICNVGGGSPVSLFQVRELLARWTGGAVPVVHQAPVAGDPRRTSADLTRAVRLLQWSPSTPLDAGLRQQFEWQTGRSERSRRARGQPVGVTGDVT